MNVVHITINTKTKKILIETNFKIIFPTIKYDTIIVSKMIEVETLGTKGKILRKKILYKN